MLNQDYRKHDLPSELLRAVEALGFESLTPIQALSFPPLRAGKDIIGESQTGSGKTIAFALPILERTHTETRVIQGLILCPTRELSEQVAHTVRSAGRFKKDLLVVSLVGGQPLFQQLRSLRHGVHIVIGTPGRILDLLGRGKLDLKSVQVVVLDEADRMLEMGFRDSIEEILGHTPKDRQTALFSATFPETIEALSRRYQKNPVRLKVVVPSSDKPQISQRAYVVTESSRLPTLIRLLVAGGFESTLVFCNFKTSVDELTVAIKQARLRVDKIHGGLEQVDRDRVMARFRNGSVRVLVATDVAARGLDITGLDAVFNFELPPEPKIYVHRIGRTGRAGKSGTAISLWRETERAKLDRIEAFTGEPIIQKGMNTLNPFAQSSPDMETLEISGGRKDKLRAGDILGALTGMGCHIEGSAIGKIEIKDHVSYVAVEKALVQRAQCSLQKGKIKGRRFFVSIV